jgi:hypothetical protein
MTKRTRKMLMEILPWSNASNRFAELDECEAELEATKARLNRLGVASAHVVQTLAVNSGKINASHNAALGELERVLREG